ncbi:TnsA endonuclease N-terminal domain-containing protein [Roseateles toxinivorans]|uniref:TnsA endonuclease N-terminal domain-containing protein n=1 Tax=Roseateles toxinivorans TaxID=270368 RepID=UPI0010622B31|nr:TnsA endonuclease N-terminal domain-containing protein [Roseateles toxinivorans]
MKPARQIITTSPHRSVGAVHASWLQDDPIHHESFLEKGGIEILLLMPMAAHIKSQPIKLIYVSEGKERTHYPDFQVRLKDGRHIIVEVKPSVFVDEHRHKFNSCSAQLARAGIEYYVCTEKSLDAERVGRAENLRDQARRAAPSDELAELLHAVRLGGHLLIADALAQGFNPQVIGHAVGRRLLTVGPSLELSPTNRLRLMENEDGHLRCSDWIGSPPWGAHVAI